MSMDTNPSGSLTLMKKMSSEIPMTISGETVRTYREACRSWRPGNSVRLRHSAASTPSSVASEAASAATESVFTTASISAALPKSWLYHLSVNPFHADVYLAALKEYAITTKMGKNRNAYTIQSHSLPSFRIITPPRPCGRARRPCGWPSGTPR